MKISSILVANRGEIACRIIKTCRKLGIRSIAVYSYADRHAAHSELADDAVFIGPSESARSYLNIDRIIAACIESGAQAVHPGYGFLSENSAFAQALSKAGICFIGPKPQVIELLGDKVASKALARRCGVECIPGIEFAQNAKPSETLKLVKHLAQSHGYPLIVKAAGGGGGRGMRRIDSVEQIPKALEAAAREGQAFFNDARVFVERMIEGGRHIEVQIIGDEHGDVRHLFDRDCTFQRNHQKVIEEAPAPNLNQSLRNNIWQAALAVCREAQYSSLGTTEFLLSPDGKFYFLEVNSRLQVEHPVTEALTGLDLVELQIRCAQGEKLDDLLHHFDSKLPSRSAIECRICAEDPARNFAPSSGRLIDFSAPTSDPSLRIDTGVRTHDEISHHYDSLIAKFTCVMPTRAQTIAKLSDVIQKTTILGVQTNLQFLSNLLAAPDFSSVTHTTASASIIAKSADHSEIAPALVAAIVLIWQSCAEATDGFRIGPPATLQGCFEIDGENLAIELMPQSKDQYMIKCDDYCETITVLRREVEHVGISCLGLELEAKIRQWSDKIWVYVASRGIEVTVTRPQLRTRNNAIGNHSLQVISPLPGKVVSLDHKLGALVKKGQAVATIESMKMEHILRAPQDGTIKAIHVRVGQTIESRMVLVDLNANP